MTSPLTSWSHSDPGRAFDRVYLCVCARARARARVCVCVCVCVWLLLPFYFTYRRLSTPPVPRPSVQRRLNRSRCRLGCGLVWDESIMCYMGRPAPNWKGQFWWIWAPIVKYKHFLLSAVQNDRTDPFTLSVVDSSGPKDAQVQLYSPGG